MSGTRGYRYISSMLCQVLVDIDTLGHNFFYRRTVCYTTMEICVSLSSGGESLKFWGCMCINKYEGMGCFYGKGAYKSCTADKKGVMKTLTVRHKTQ